MFERYYENCEMFDLYTHGIGPGIVGIVVHKLIDYLGGVCKEKLRHDKQSPLSYAPLAVCVSKIKSIVGTVVVDDVEEGTGRLKKADEVKKAAAVVVETMKPTDAPKVKKKTDIKHTERKRHQVSSSVHEVQVVDSYSTVTRSNSLPLRVHRDFLTSLLISISSLLGTVARKKRSFQSRLWRSNSTP